MKHYTDISGVYQGTELSFFLVEGEKDKPLNRYIRGNMKSIEKHMAQRGVRYAAFNILSRSFFGSRSLKNLFLRQCPTLDKEELENHVRVFKNKYKKQNRSRLVYISSVRATKEGSFCADILCEDDFDRDGDYLTTFYKFLDVVVRCEIARENIITTGKYKYRIPTEECHSYNWDNCEYLGYDMLADNVSGGEECDTVSPIHFDNKFNMSLPLYPQINIKLDPLPKALYILFLNHPEGILLKEIKNYEDELRSIYSAVSGRKNRSVLDKMFKSLTNPNENPLHKNLSIIRKCFLSKLRFDIASRYIPSHGRSKAHFIPLDNRLIEMPGISM